MDELQGVLVYGILLTRPLDDEYGEFPEEDWEWDRLKDADGVRIVPLGDFEGMPLALVLSPISNDSYISSDCDFGPSEVKPTMLKTYAEWDMLLRNYCEKFKVPMSNPGWWLGYN